jgi:hypothetical protein
VSNSRFQHSQAIYTTNLPAAKEAMATEKERKLALDLVGRRKTAWKETMKRMQEKSDISRQQRKVVPETPKVTQATKIDWTPLQETPQWRSSIKM